MMYREDDCEGVRVLRLETENFDAATTRRLRSQWLPTLNRGDAVVLDCNQVEFVDSAALGLIMEVQALVGAHRLSLSHVGYRLSLCLTRLPEEFRPSEFETTQLAVDVMADSGIIAPSIRDARADESNLTSK